MEQSTKYFMFFVTMYASQCVHNNQLELDGTINQIFHALFHCKVCLPLCKQQSTGTQWNNQPSISAFFHHKVCLPMRKQQSTGTQWNNQSIIHCCFVTMYAPQCVNNNELELDGTINQTFLVFSSQSRSFSVYTTIKQSTKYFLLFYCKV